MTREISQRELRNDSGAVLRAVEAGEDFVVTRNGTALAELRPLQRRRLVSTRELLATSRRLAPTDATRLRSELDDIVDQGVGNDR